MRPTHILSPILFVLATLCACDDGGELSPDAAPVPDAAPDGAAPDGAAPDGALTDAEPDGSIADAAPDASPEPIDTEALATALDTALAGSPENITGMSLLVFDATDTRVIELTVGDFAPDRRVPIASASKMVSALVFLRLIEEGALRFDSTTGEVLDWDGPFVDVTLDMLNAFTSGMPGNALCTIAVRQTLAQCAGSMEGLEPLGAPGAVYDYGSTHQHVAAAMAEAATAELWDALFRRTITVPLGIDDPALRYVTLPQAQRGESNPLIAGGMVATADEYARILSMVFHRGRIDGDQHIAEASIDRMGQNLYVDADVRTSPAANYGYTYHYGFGSWLECDGPVASCPVISSPGAFGFTPWVDWETGYYAILAMDSGETGGAEFGMGVATELKPMIRAALAR